MSTVCVFGGTGFLGRSVVRRLAAEGNTVRVAVRSPERVTLAEGITGVRADVRDPASVAAAVQGADAVVNTVSAYIEKGGITFDAIHVQGAATLAREAARAGAARHVLVSGIGADPASRSPYIRARGAGEAAVREQFPGAAIARPGVLFGPGDGLFGALADVTRLLPAIPLVGGGTARVQPVYVEDVAQAVARMATDPECADRTYELAGPRAYTVRELVEYALHLLGRKRLLVPLPFPIAELQARMFELLPRPPLTTAQVDLLRVDTVLEGSRPGLRELGIEPKSIEEIVPDYLKKD